MAVPYPFVDPVVIGGIIILIFFSLLVATKFEGFNRHLKDVGKFRLKVVVGILIGVALWISALISV